MMSLPLRVSVLFMSVGPWASQHKRKSWQRGALCHLNIHPTSCMQQVGLMYGHLDILYFLYHFRIWQYFSLGSPISNFMSMCAVVIHVDLCVKPSPRTWCILKITLLLPIAKQWQQLTLDSDLLYTREYFKFCVYYFI